ncbi:MAG: VOC family protein [Povalibacter sp.]
MDSSYQLRIARPAGDLTRSEAMYREGLGLEVVGRFEDHEGFDGVMLAHREAGYHFEFTRHRKHPITPTPTVEDLVVFYVPQFTTWQRMCESMQAAGFTRSVSFSPYWNLRGHTFEDRDGYRVVLWHGAWPEHTPAAADVR